MRPGGGASQTMTQVNPSISPEQEDVFTSTADSIPTFPDRHEPSMALALFALEVALRWNVRSQRAELSQSSDEAIPHAPINKWVTLTDRMTDRLRDLLARRCTYQGATSPLPMVYGRERWSTVLNAHLCSRERDPFLEWLRERPAWDHAPRLDTYLDDLFGAGQSPLVRWVGQFLFLGPVHRAHTPGAQLAEMPVLVGRQGIGKSALMLNLFPTEHAGWVNDGLHLAADPKVRAEALLGRVLVEASEMAGSTRADLDSLKSFISRQDDGGIRLAFRRNPEDAPRRCIIVGTSNRLDSLPNDPSGNRRFIPVVLNRATQAVEDYMDTYRDQLWAEAVHRHAEGTNPKLPRDLMPQAAEAAESHRNRDVMLEDAIEGLPNGWEGTLAEIASKVGLLSPTDASVKLSMRETKRLSAALTGLGWVKRQVKQEGIKSRVWKLDAVPGTP